MAPHPAIRAPHPEVFRNATCPNIMWEDSAHTKPMVNVPQLVVVHTTETPCQPGDRYGVAAGFMNPAAKASANYVVDPAGVLQVVWDARVSDNCGLNPNTLAIEHCAKLVSPAWDQAHAARWTTDPNHKALLTRGANLAARLMLHYGIPFKRVTAAEVRAWVEGGRRRPLGYCGHDTIREAFPQFTDHWDPGPAFPWDVYAAQLATHRARMIRRAGGTK